MSKYSNMFGEESVTNLLALIEDWRYLHQDVKTSSKRINYILNGVLPSDYIPTDISEIGFNTIIEASEANKQVDALVNDFADMKESMKPAENLILEALYLLEGRSKATGLRGLLVSFKTALDSSIEETRKRIKAKIEQAVEQFSVKIHFKVEPMLQYLVEKKRIIRSISKAIDEVIDALDYLIYASQDEIVKDLARRRKEMFVKSLGLMSINNGQLDQMQKICEQKKSFVDELKMTVIPIIDSVMRSAIISGSEDLSQISEALKKIL